MRRRVRGLLGCAGQGRAGQDKGREGLIPIAIAIANGVRAEDPGSNPVELVGVEWSEVG